MFSTKGFFIFCMLLVISIKSYTQNKVIDSLQIALKNAKSDTARINLSNQLVTKMSEVNLDSAISLGNKTIIKAQKLKFRKGEAEALNTTASSLIRKGEFETAKKNLDDAIIIAESLKDSLRLSTAYGNYGMLYGMQGKYDSSATFFKNAIAMLEANGRTTNLDRYYSGLAISFQMRSDYQQALLYQQKSLKLAETNKNLSSQAYTLLNMGNTYQKINDTLRAEKTLLKAVDFAKQAGVKNVEIYSYSNLASMYQDMEKWELEYDYAIKASTLAEQLGDTSIEVASYSKAAIALSNLKKYDEAITLINKGMAKASNEKQPIVIVQLNEAMGRTLELQQKYQEAIPYFEKCLEAGQATDQYDGNMAAINVVLAKCYEKTGDYKKALSHYKLYAEIKDSITSKEKIQEATEQTMTYEFNKKQAITQREQDLKDAEVKRVRNQQYFAIGLLFIFLLAAGSIAFLQYRSNLQKRRTNRLLKHEKQKAESTLSELKLTQAQLIQSEKMASLGELTAGIAHEIQNPLNFVNNFSEVSNELIVEMNEELDKGDLVQARFIASDIKQNLEKINHHGKRAEAIVKGMLLHSRTSTGVREAVDINKLADEYLRLAYHGLRAKDKSFNATLETNFDNSIKKISIIPQDIGRVILNLITNAFYAVNEKKAALPTEMKHGSKAERIEYIPTVSVSTTKYKDFINIYIKDNGNGIPDNVVEKIFQPFFTTKPTGQGTGLGLSLSYDIVKAHGGTLEVQTEQGEGTTFIIHLPKLK